MAGFGGEYSGYTYNRRFHGYPEPANNHFMYAHDNMPNKTSQLPAQHGYILEENTDDDNVKRYVGTGVSLASLIVENLLSHPFVVLRRQCQVHNSSKKFHLLPVSLAPVIVHLHKRQGFTTLWKGIGSVCMVRGMTLAVEDLISKASPWPKDINNCNSFLSFCQHIFLKSISIAIVTPFYSASFVETVQSDIASDKPGILDVFKEGAVRLLSWGAPSKGRMLPIWAIVVPTVAFGISKYLFNVSVKGVISKVLHFRQRQIQAIENNYKPSHHNDSPTAEQNNSKSDEINLSASLFSLIISDIVFYPMETVIHRLHLQGTRTIIDNLDTGYSVLPILTGYEGFIDCYRTAIGQEGFIGLYKGFGSLILQFTAHIAVIKLTKWLITEVTILLKPPKPALTSSTSQQNLYPPPQERYLFN